MLTHDQVVEIAKKYPIESYRVGGEPKYNPWLFDFARDIERASAAPAGGRETADEKFNPYVEPEATTNQTLTEAIEWCIAHGNCGPRTRATLIAARSALATAPTMPHEGREPTGDELRKLVRNVREASGGPSDAPQPADYVLGGWRAALATAPTMSEAESMERCALAATDRDRVALIHALQKALAHWMPSVFDERSAHDAYLLVGYEGETEPRCWGDEMMAALPRWTPVGDSLPAEPGWYLAMLKPNNDWGLMSDTALQVEFDAYTSKPKAFTCFYEYRGDEDITEAVTHWMPMPRIDRAAAKGASDAG
jgi:hypothetical protein